ncbi:MAG TPA: hypothetical protein VFP97_04955 [Chitinophagaceae bacterium]|nr:hypothetical protein [Chitinophagaceae bacterium]
MDQQQANKHRLWWGLGFLVSAALLAIAIVTHWEWLTLLLPFVATTFVKALDIM